MSAAVTILAGPARCGKTQRLLADYRRALTDSSPGAALWIAPTYRATQEIRRRLLSAPWTGCLAPQCFTFEQFGRRLLDATLLEARPLPPPLVRQVVEGLVAQASADGELPYFAPIADSQGFLNLVIGLIQELKRLEVWPEELAAAARTPKDRQLCRIYERYQRLLARHRLYDWQGRFWAAREHLRTGQVSCLASPRQVFVDGFTDFTRTEHEVLQLLAERADSLTITLPADEPGRRDELFAKTTDTLHELRRRHPAAEVQDFGASGSDWPAMDRLERYLFANPREVPPGGDVAGIEILPAAGATQEIELVAARVKGLLTQGPPGAPGSPVAPADILVVFRTLGETADLVREVFGQFGIPTCVAAPIPLDRSATVRALFAWLRLEAEDWPFRQVVSVLGQPSPGGDAVPWQSGQASAALVRLVHELQIPTGREALLASVADWAARVPADSPATSADRRARMAEDAQLALPLVRHVASLLAGLPRQATLAEWSRAVEGLARQAGLLADENDLAWRQFIDALETRHRLAELLDPGPRRLSLVEFLAKARRLARDESLADGMEETGRVRVLSAEQVRGLSAAYVFLAGLSEKSFPQPHRDDCIYSEAETRELAAAGLPLVPHAVRRGFEMLLFYEVATRATRRLVLSYPSLDPSGMPLSPSPYLVDLEHAFAQAGVLRGQPADLSVVPDHGEVYSLRDFRVRAAANVVAGDGGLLTELKRHAVHATKADQIVAGLRLADARRDGRGFGPFEGMLPSSDARAALLARYGPQRCWSPSQLEHYASCPYRFLLDSVLAIEPLGSPELEVDSQGRGRVLHAVLAEAHRHWNRQAAQGAAAAEEVEEFPALLNRLLRDRVEGMRGTYPLAEGMLQIDARRVATWLQAYPKQMAQYAAAWQDWDDPLRPTYFEVSFGPSRTGVPDEADAAADTLSSADPFELECEGEIVRFAGRIDRIDIGRLAGRMVFAILDYKSGTSSARSYAQAMRAGRALQLPIYALAAEQVLAAQAAAPFRAAYWHVSTEGYQDKNAFKFHLEVDGRLAVNPDWQQTELELRRQVGRLVRGVRQGEFPMHSADDRCTSYCPYRTVCRVNQVRNLEKTWQPPAEDSA